MTVDAYDPATITYTVSGTGPYAIAHPYDDTGDFAVTMIAIDGTRTALTLTTDYSIAPAGPAASGDLTLTAAAAATYDGYTIEILRDTDVEQGWNGTTAREAGMEAQLDRMVMGLQEARRDNKHSIRVTGAAVDPVDPEASSFFGFDADGKPATFAGAASIPVSTALTPFVGASGLSSARDVLGVNGFAADFAELDTRTDIAVGDTILVTSGYNGPEIVEIKAAATYTANSQEVYDLTASGLQAVSTRMWFKTISEVESDPRTLTEGSEISVHGGGLIRVVAFGGDLTSTRLVVSGPSFNTRDATASSECAGYPDGTICKMEGRLYEADSTATGSSSATNDLGVDGLVPWFDVHPEHYGSLTRSTPITLDDGDIFAGDSLRKTVITNTSSTSVLDAPGNAGTSKDINVMFRDFMVRTYDYASGTGVGLDSHNQGYPILENVEIRGGLTAAARLKTTVGLTGFNTLFGYSQNAMLMDNEGGGIDGNTYTRMFAPAFRISDNGIHNINNGRGVQLFAPLFEGLSKIVSQEDSGSRINNFVAFGGWSENTVEGKVAYDITGSNYGVGPETVGRIIEGCNVPVIHGMYWAGNNVYKGSFYPKLNDQHLTPVGTKGTAFFRDQDSDKHFDWSGTTSSWGTSNSYGISATLPKAGDFSTPDEKYYRQGVFNSIGMANNAGIYEGSGNPCENLLSTDFSQTSFVAGKVYWPYSTNLGGTYSITSGQSDPYGGTSAFLIEDGRIGSTDIAAFATGGKWLTLIVIGKAKAAGDVLQFYINSNGGADAQAKTLEVEMPDTEWRIYHTHTYLNTNSGANYRVGIGATRIDLTSDYTTTFDYASGGGVTIARAAVYEGADLRPVLQWGQSVPTGFRFIHGTVESIGSAKPTTGKYWMGDRVKNTAPSIDGNNMVLTGWRRLTTGSGHTLGTDWAAEYVSAVSPAT